MIKCLFGQHEYEVLSTEEFTDMRGNIIGKVIVNRCKICGKIKEIRIKTVDGVY